MELRRVTVGVVDARGHAVPMGSGPGHVALVARGHPPRTATVMHRPAVSIFLTNPSETLVGFYLPKLPRRLPILGIVI